ncbi:DUF4249 domain-containing protein [Robiginitalea sp. SC105]|uniref:DUF4249 domain-containing protein n=1 Tax=Robiginitalea sp. SC105 TaxID=2762332 RepID=UPI0016395EDF|nr:DUF4249 domain-containing protein [Robiginitalea sp. SC105]MBC2838739.1 DUF4249 domain-containing protein [Robiginitalea sp. SC105]
MPFRPPIFCSKFTASFLTLFALLACTDPVDPEFSYEEGLVYIDAFASDAEGASYVQVFESGESFGRQTNEFLGGARVRFIRQGDGAEVLLAESGDRYLPPDGFAIARGEQWRLEVVLEDGRRYQSGVETAAEPVPIADLSVRYDPELVFVGDYDRRVPGHRISVDFQDPPGEENYYFWQFRSYEQLVYCQVCYNYSVYRDGECFTPNPDNPGPPLKEYYTYSCEEACWQIRYNDRVEVFSDEFTDGTQINSLPVADILLFQKRNILVNLQQYSLGREAYRYYKTLKDLVDNNSGFNAPIPAALLGNLFNPDNPEEYVLGRFTIASQASRDVFIERIFIEEAQLEELLLGQAEEFGSAPPPVTSSAPCQPGPYRTDVEPEGWQR